MSIGEVLAELRPEFPDTTISKLRFLEAEGLVEPERTPAGYRKYSWRDLDRLRFVLSAQRDRYLPLRVIRAELEARDTGDDVAPRRPVLVAVPDSGEPAAAPTDALVRRAELVERTAIDPGALAELEELGMVTQRTPGWYDADALVIAAAVAGLASYGIEVRHLRGYKAAADRDVGLFAQLVGPLARQKDPAARARAAAAAQELTGLAQQLRAALVRAGLRDTLGR
ncbi:MerR family transcriptional regulator [Asanoa sp. WMMD1127]|uniref:transcriptional regulator FtsR n=1 Tax=Asanoa sp. WMMD1127 TaxID=3016107 RepID=UPI00241714C9|nr:MerR family transcriptional regulator [Asanoa sp. WMMD1127]MDG4826150.1 MerR family transcriptional regulator [Asanoa sp. WMMD1127]